MKKERIHEGPCGMFFFMLIHECLNDLPALIRYIVQEAYLEGWHRRAFKPTRMPEHSRFGKWKNSPIPGRYRRVRGVPVSLSEEADKTCPEQSCRNAETVPAPTFATTGSARRTGQSTPLQKYALLIQDGRLSPGRKIQVHRFVQNPGRLPQRKIFIPD